MTPEQQRIAIAEACGWNRKKCPVGSIPWGATPDEPKTWWFVHQLPDYLSDLNAMNEAAMQLRIQSPLKYVHYISAIGQIVAKFNSDLENQFAISAHDATAAQRAEAFLRTLDLWVDK